MPTATKPASSNGVVSGTAFTNPTNAYTDDSSVATLTSTSKNTTVGTYDWGFAAFSTSDIPANATVTEVRVVADIRLTAAVTGGLVGLQGAISNSVVGSEVTETGTTLVRQSTVVTGATLTDLRSAGVIEARIRYSRGNTTTSSTAEVEYVEIQVDYTVPQNYTQNFSPATPSLSFTGAVAKRAQKTLSAALGFAGAIVTAVARQRAHTADITFTVSFQSDYQPAVQATPALVIIHYHVE